jgi:hypothetical protein
MSVYLPGADLPSPISQKPPNPGRSAADNDVLGSVSSKVIGFCDGETDFAVLAYRF